ncbi:MAG: sigma-54-dependent Fis family transcriptional regulator [Cytophagales bacterium]|nr:MAG: sigma-54-dependent Fis family transcriptional regulator [Cytophagales bacterium]
MARILIIDDDTDVLMAAKLLLKRHFDHVDVEKNPERIPFLVTNGKYDAILLDMNFQRDLSSGREGFMWLDRILDIDSSANVVLITAYGDVEMAVRAMKVGAKDFVLKPWQNDKLLETLKNAMSENRAGVSVKDVKSESPKAKPSSAGHSLIATSLPMRQVLDTVGRVANTDANVLILGENGTGKDLIARMLHEQSGRSAKPFISVDVGALSESLFESELFGHVKGAFTDARDDRAGRFEEAQGGTIFLDEIGNITLPQQARLLTVLQQRQVTRIGSNKPKPIDVRLICATNVNIQEQVASRDGSSPRFRQDLLYRINTIELQLPALRDRPDDIEPLANHFLNIYRKQYNRPVTGLSPALIRQLKQHRWPGNVRELQHAVERAVILAQGNILESTDFFGGLGASGTAQATTALSDSLQLDDMERRMIQQAMQRFGGNITDVARELGLSRQALYRRLEKYSI